MVTTITTAVDQDLMQTALRATLDPATIPGLDGYLVTEGQPVVITGDKTIRPCMPGEDADGIATESLFWTQVPGAAGPLLAQPDARTRVSWLPFKFGRKVLRVPIGAGGLQAGNRVAYDSATMTYVAAQPLAVAATTVATTTVDATDLEGTIPAGETPVTSTGAQPTVTIAGDVTAATTATTTATLAGTALPTEEVGICWMGGLAGTTGLIIV